VLKTIIFLLQESFSSDFVTDCVLAVQILTPLFSLDVPNFIVFFRLLNRKFNGDSKNVHKSVALSLQVGFTGNFVLDYSFKLCLWQFKL